jgi:hypothetical protein
MFRTNWVILLSITLAIGLAGCGDSTGGYGIFRSRDIITVFVPLPDTSEIADVKVDNKALRMAIDTGEKIVPREIKLQRRLLQVVESDETVEIHGKNRINDYAVIHLRAFDTKYKVSKFIKVYAHTFYYRSKGTSARKEPEPFDNSGAFRFGDKIVAYSQPQDNIDSQPDKFKIWINSHKIKPGHTFEYKIITDEKSGHPALILKRYDTESNEVLRNLRFLLTDLAPNETVKIEEMKDFGGRIVIAELEVLPQESQLLDSQVPEQISDR